MSGHFLESARLGFRHWRASDLPLAQALWGDPAVTRFIAARELTAADIRARLDREIATQASDGIQYWPVFLRSDGSHVGCCGLRPRAGHPDVPELGVHIASAHWRRGYAAEAARSIVGFAFGSLGFRALFAGHNPGNIASRELLARLGFVHTHDELYAPTGLQHPSYLLRREPGVR